MKQETVVSELQIEAGSPMCSSVILIRWDFAFVFFNLWKIMHCTAPDYWNVFVGIS